MHKNLVATVLGVTGAVFMVSTADADQAAMAPAGFNWSGFYVGVGGGFGASTYKLKDSGNVPRGGQGRFGDLTIGYDHMLTDRILLGGFIDTHLGNIKHSAGQTLPGVSLKGVLTNDGYGFDAVARLGYVLNDSTLGYILGGYTWERFKLKETISAPPAINVRRTEQESRGGFVLGAGMETAIGHNWTIKTEYRYSSYGDSGAALFGVVFPSTHTFHIAANYRFGAEGTGPAIASPAYDWTGFYIGAAAGAGEVVHKLIQSAAGPFHAETNGYGSDAVSGELDAGYDHDFGKFVAGIMVDGISSHDSSAILKMDYGFDILGRIGMKVNPSTLAYVLGGYSWGHFKLEDVSYRTDWSSSGFSVGGGLETAITANTTLGIEYRYAQFAREDFDLGGAAFEVEPSRHTARVVLKYKFN